MKKTVLYMLCLFTLLCFFINASLGKESLITMTVLYDNFIFIEDTESDWGFACLIEGTEKTILFDTGTQGEILLKNAEKLNVDLKKLDQIVISHIHRDHTGGLETVLDINSDIAVYFPSSFPENFSRKIKDKGAKCIRVDTPVEICKNVFLTGEMGDRIKEQSLILDTDKGLIIVTGCSHQGIDNILKKAKEIRNKQIHLVFGGFHLLNHTDEQVKNIIQVFRSLDVQKCGATHCTGEKAIALFKEAYGVDYEPMGVGKTIEISCTE